MQFHSHLAVQFPTIIVNMKRSKLTQREEQIIQEQLNDRLN